MQQNEPTPGEALVFETALPELKHFAERTGMAPELVDRALGLLQVRVAVGRAKYGTYLMTFNSRNALRDAWEEAADLMFYLQQAAMEDPALSPGVDLALDAARLLVLTLSPSVPDGA